MTSQGQWILERLRILLDCGSPRRCLQGCGKFISAESMFCSVRCRARYNPETWREGSGKQSLTSVLRQSLKEARS